MGPGPLSAFQCLCLRYANPLSQNYDPAGNVWVSALVALIPIIFFFLPAHEAAPQGGDAAGTIHGGAVPGPWRCSSICMPVANALAAGVYGFFDGLWPIAWTIVAAVFFL